MSSTEAQEHGLYDYWRYNVNRLIIIAVMIGLQIFNCLILISKGENAARIELYNITTKILCICYINSYMFVDSDMCICSRFGEV